MNGIIGDNVLLTSSSIGMPIPAYLANFVEITFDAVIVFDSQEQITYWNPAAERMYGWKAHETLGKTSEELRWPAIPFRDDGDSKKKLMSLERAVPLEGVYKTRGKDSSFFWVEYTVRAMLDVEGQISGYIAIHRDITERKHTEQEIGLISKLPIENPNPVMRLTLDGSILFANQTCEPLLDYWKQKTGKTIPDEVQEGIHQAWESRSKKEVEIDYNGKTLLCTLVPIIEAGYVNLYGIDITERKQVEEALLLAREHAERTTERIARLQKVTAALSEALTPPQVAEVMVRQGAPALGAISGTMMLLTEDGQTLDIVYTVAPEAIARPFQQIPLSLNLPASDAVRSGQTVWIESNQQYLERYPHLAESITAWGHQAAVSLPIVYKGHTLGSLNLSFDQVRPYTLKDEEYALTLARQGAQALERTRLYEAEQKTRLTAERTAERITRLQQITEVLAIATTPAQWVDAILQQGIGALGAHAGILVELIDNGQFLKTIAALGYPVEAVRMDPVPLSSPNPMSDCIRTGQAIWFQSHKEFAVTYPSLAEFRGSFGNEATVSIPLLAGDRVLGGLAFSFVHPRRFDREEKEFFLAVAHQCAQGMERARANEALRNSEERARRTYTELQSMYEQSPVGMVQLDPDLRYIRINEVMARMNGLPVSEHIGKKLHEMVPNLAPQVEVEFRRVLETGQSVTNIELRGETLADPGVQHTWLESWFPQFDEQENIVGVNVVAQDITERKRSEQAINAFAQQQKALYQLADQLHRAQTLEDVFNAALDAILSALQCDRASILLFDKAGLMRFVAWRGLSDFYRKATDGHSPWPPDIKNPEPICMDELDTADLSDSLKTIIQGEGIGALAFIPLISHGKLMGKFMTYFNSPHIFSEGEVELSLTIARQLAFGVDRKRAEENLRALNETLEQKVKEKTIEVRKLASDLTKAEQRERHRIAQILHDDLQQRLYAIQMQIPLLQNALEADETTGERDFAEINEQLNEVVAVMRHLSVDLSPPILRDEGLAQAIKWLASQMQEQYDLQIELHAEEAFAVPDPDMQVLLYSSVRELLFNIVKHAGVNQAVVSLHRINNDLHIEVRDTGKGFNAAVLAQRASPSSAGNEYRQPSFGLPTLRHRLSLFGGDMDIESQPHTGTRITLRIPVYPK